MDFAVCPSCGQSVLDDDATECPFCGSSMKAKPGTKPAAGKTSSAAPAAKSPAKQLGKSSAAKSAADDLPFGFDETTSTAIPAARQPTKGRAYQVICPMCESVGFVPESAAGKDVKCANPKCMVPVFTAPTPEPEPEAPPPKKPSSNLIFLGLGTAAVVGVIGAAVYFFASRPTNEVIGKPVDLDAIIAQSKKVDDTPGATSQPAMTDQPDPASTGTPAENVRDDKAIVSQALQQCRQLPLVSDRTNRSKPYSRRYAAEAFAMAGDIAGAKAQIEALASVGPQLPFYQVTPWVEIYWQERRQGRSDAAKSAIDAALKLSDQLPVRGTDQFDIACRLGQALVIDGRHEDARKLISAHQSSDLEGQQSADLQWLAADAAARDLTSLIKHRPIVARSAPQAAVVAAGAGLRGHESDALAYAQSWPDLATKTDCLAGWCEVVVWQAGDAAIGKIESAIAQLPPANQAYLWSRASRIAKLKDRQAAAEQCLSNAGKLLDPHALPENYVIPNTRSLSRTRPAWQAQWGMVAAAAAELAAARQEVSGDSIEAEKAMKVALRATRGLGPALPAALQLTEAAARLGLSSLRNQLKEELELRTDDEARIAANEYRRALTDLETAAQRRHQLQVEILSRLTRIGMESAVWAFVSQSASGDDLSVREDFLNSTVATWLHERFLATGSQNEMKLLTAARTNAGLPEVTRPAEVIFREQMADGNQAAAWQTASDSSIRAAEREVWMLSFLIQQALSDKPLSETWKLISPLNDVALREQAIEWCSWMASRKGEAHETWKHQSQLTSVTEKVVLARGVIAGIRDREMTTKPATTETAAAME